MMKSQSTRWLCSNSEWGTALLSPNQRSAIRDYLKNPPTLKECISDLKDASDGRAGKLALRDAIMMSAADGTVDEDEFEVLGKIAAGLGMKENVVDDLLDWVMEGYDWMERGLAISMLLEVDDCCQM